MFLYLVNLDTILLYKTYENTEFTKISNGSTKGKLVWTNAYNLFRVVELYTVNNRHLLNVLEKEEDPS